MKVLGKILAIVWCISPKLAKEWRMAVVDRIMCTYSDSWFEKIKTMERLNRFLDTMHEPQRIEVIESLGIPAWSQDGVYRRMI